MKPIGGELALKNELNYFFTDSGRSSLRLFCRNFSNKKILIPDFLCNVIIDILEQEGIKYDFYHVKKDLTIDEISINKSFDVLYIINYFGKKTEIVFDVNEKIVVEDNVFFVDFGNDRQYKNWFAFNSYRKITALSDGSLIKTNLTLVNYIKNNDSLFATLKYKAKQRKYDYLIHDLGVEFDYLDKFEEAENILDNQTEIFVMSKKSLGLLNGLISTYEEEKVIRGKNYRYLIQEFRDIGIDFQCDFYSYCIIMTEKRDALRKFLFKKHIFLPIHWPYSKGNNPIHRTVLSIPVFYSCEETLYLANAIKEFYATY